MRRRLIRTLALWALAAMLFTQGALVANACLRLDTAPHAAFNAIEMADCSDMTVTAPNACLSQYLYGSDQNVPQSWAMAPVQYSAMPASAPWTTLAADARAGLPPPVASPPLSIRFCSLQI